MNGEGKIVEFRLKNKRFETSLSLSDFHAQVQRYLVTIVELQETLQSICGLFENEPDIWQDQCECTIDSVQAFSKPVSQFYRLLLDTTQLPDDVTPFRYPLIISLNRMNEQVQNLIYFLSEFRAICRKKSKQLYKLRQTINELLTELMQGCDEVQRKSYILFDLENQMRIQKRNLIQA